MKWLFRIVLFLLLGIAALLAYLKVVHGGGEFYPDVSSAPQIEASRISAPIQLPYPPGMVASSADGRLFYTYHMLHKPERFTDATVFEWVNGQGVPFPNLELQKRFHGAMGITADQQNRLWMVIPGALEGKLTQLLAIDRSSGELLVDYQFAKGIAGFAQDMRVSPDGNTVYLADTGMFRFTDAGLIVFDVASKTARTVLEGHESVSPQDWVMRKPDGTPHRLAFGLLTFVVGVDGIALSSDGQWLYYGTMSHDSLYRVPTAVLRDSVADEASVSASVERVGRKPLSDGIELLADNTVLITDVENGGLASLSPQGQLSTLTKDAAVDWADSVTVAADGSIWFTDSKLTALLDQFAKPADKATLQKAGPYFIYRVAP